MRKEELSVGNYVYGIEIEKIENKEIIVPVK